MTPWPVTALAVAINAGWQYGVEKIKEGKTVYSARP
jgi:hypothetical protein